MNNIRDFFFGDEKLAKDNFIFSMIIFTPASIISSILSIPFSVIFLPTLILSKQVQNKILIFMLYIQHSLSLGALYSVQEYLFDSLEIKDILFGSFIAFISFYNSIKALIKETMGKI